MIKGRLILTAFLAVVAVFAIALISVLKLNQEAAFTVPHEGKYDIYAMNADGSDNSNITPEYFPASLLCWSPIFSKDDSRIYFIGQWQP